MDKALRVYDTTGRFLGEVIDWPWFPPGGQYQSVSNAVPKLSWNGKRICFKTTFTWGSGAPAERFWEP